jgi:UDP-glucose 4-epimerase
MKILVTGGAGFIASHIADKYISEGHTVVIVDDLSSGKSEYINPKATFYKADIRDFEALKEIFEKEKPTVVNHHAAQISVRRSVEDPRLDCQINLLGLLNILELSRHSGITKVIFASSGGVVYGDAKQIPTSEDYTPLQPLSPYGVAKLASEYYLNFYKRTYGINYVALRYGNIYGPRQNPHGEAGVIAIFSKKLIKGEEPLINGDGRQTRDYVYVKDVVAANFLSLKDDVSGAFNIGTSKETDVVYLYSQISQILGKTGDPKHGEAKLGEQKRSCLNAELAYKVLGWKPKYSIEEGLKETVEFFKNN